MATKKKMQKRPPKKRPAPKDPTLRQMLAIIDGFFVTQDGEELAQVLSATRGPDDDNADKKDVTTAIIRRKAFPKNGDYLGVTLTDFGDNHVVRKQLSHDHFGNHARRAFEALGLKWDKVNK